MVVKILGDAESLNAALGKAGAAAKKAADDLKKVEAAGKGLDRAGDSASRAANKIKTIESAGKRLESVGKKMTLGITAPLVGMAALSLKSAGEFGSSMAQFGVATDLSGSQLTQFSDLAKKMGAETVFSAQEAAGAMLELAKGGLKPAQIEAGALKASMDLASAGGMNLADAGKAVSTAMNTFKMDGSQTATIADALAGGANASAASVDDLTLGLAQAGQQAAASGFSLQETTAALAAFTDAGMAGSDAGTSLKTMLTRLADPTKKSADAMKELGLDFFNAKGKMIPLEKIAGQLKAKMKGLTQEQRLQALSTIFGSDATRAANILFEKGAKGIAGYTEATSTAGNAAKMGEAKMAGWAGASDQLSGSIETAALSIGEALAPAATDIAGKIQTAVNWFSQLDKGTQETIVKFGALAAAIGPAAWALGAAMRTTGTIIGGFKSMASVGGRVVAMFGAKTAATIADTAATEANAAATKTAGTSASAASAGMGSAAASATLLGGALTVAASAFSVYKTTEQFGALAGSVSTFANMAGGPLNFLAIAMGNSSRNAAELADGMRAVSQSLGDMAAAGNIDGISQKWALMAADMSPDQLLAVADSVPGFNQALNSAGLRIDAVSGKLTSLPPAQLDAVIAPLQAKLDAAKSILNGLKQAKKPNVDAINKAKAVVRQAQSDMDGFHQRRKPIVDANVSQAHSKLVGIGAELNALQSKKITVTTEWKNIGKGAAGVSANGATGGQRSGMVTVGERGPELVSLPAGSEVFTHSQSLRMMATDNLAKGRRSKKPTKAERKAAKEEEKRKYRDEHQSVLDELRGSATARTSLADLASQRQDLMGRITGSVSGFTGIGGFDLGARQDAIAELQSAQSEVNTSAVGSSSRQAAQARLASAQQKLSSTPATVGAWLAQRVDKVRRWRDVLGKLKGTWGGTAGGRQLLQEIYDKGPDGGVELGEELLRNPGELQSLVSLQDDSNWLANDVASGNHAVIDLQNRYNQQAQFADQVQNLTVVLKLDGKDLHQALLKLKSGAGGKALGLA